MHHMRKWRSRNRIASLWQTHKMHAKRRRIAVIWTRAQFFEFCLRTDYHIKVAEGMTIERKEAAVGYSLDNCVMLTFDENSLKGAFIDRWLKKQPWARAKGMA